MPLRLPPHLSPDEVNEWIDGTVEFKIDKWTVDGDDYWSHMAEAIGHEFDGAPTQSNFERSMFSLIDDADTDYEYDSEGYIKGFHTTDKESFRFREDNEEFADKYLRGEVIV